MQTIIKPGDVLPDPLFHDPDIPLKATVGTHPGQQLYSKQAPRAWGDECKQIDSYHQVAMPMYLGGSDEVEIKRTSVDLFLWRLRDTALAAAERSGVSQRIVHEMCVAFGADAPLLYQGGLVSSNRDIATLPAGTILYAGHPEVPSLLSVYEWSEGFLHTLLGQNRQEGVPVTIWKMEGSPTPDTAPADDLTLSRIALRAWRVGKRYKTQQGWCPVFENSLASLGISHESVSAAGSANGPGDELESRDAIATLPEGTILWHRFPMNNGIAVYVRENSARTKSKTRRVWGCNDPGNNSHPSMTVMSTPDEPAIGFVVNGAQLQTAPEGTEFHRSGYGTNYVKGATDHSIDRWCQYVITHIPTEENAA